MARTIDAAAHARRREGFLDAAQQLLETKGYQAMTIGDVLAACGTSKGAFYHYFGSKQELLDALLNRMLERIIDAVTPIFDDPRLPALHKLDQFITAQAQWKSGHRTLVLAAARAWYGDDNALPRLRLRTVSADKLGTLLSGVVGQGNREGVFDAGDPALAGRLLYAVLEDLHDWLLPWFIGDQPPQGGDPALVRKRVAGYNTALERLLGAPTGSIHLIDDPTIDAWFG